EFFAAAVFGMGFAGENDLEFSCVLADFTEAIEVGKDQVGAFVTGGAASETDGEGFRVEAQAGFFLHFFKEFVFGDEMGGPDFFGRKTESAAQAEIVFAPRWDVAVEDALHGRASPGGGVHAVGDGFNVSAGEHAAGNFAVQFGNAVD